MSRERTVLRSSATVGWRKLTDSSSSSVWCDGRTRVGEGEGRRRADGSELRLRVVLVRRRSVLLRRRLLLMVRRRLRVLLRRWRLSVPVGLVRVRLGTRSPSCSHSRKRLRRRCSRRPNTRGRLQSGSIRVRIPPELSLLPRSRPRVTTLIGERLSVLRNDDGYLWSRRCAHERRHRRRRGRSRRGPSVRL